jgi:hypothetical protein
MPAEEELVGGAIGEVTYKLMRNIGVELASPRALRKRREFPDCEEILKKLLGSEHVASKNLKKYITLCRLTAMAWLTWCMIAISIWFSAAIWLYHRVRDLPLPSHLFYPPVTCGVLLLMFGSVGFISLPLYSCFRLYAETLETECCEAEYEQNAPSLKATA